MHRRRVLELRKEAPIAGRDASARGEEKFEKDVSEVLKLQQKARTAVSAFAIEESVCVDDQNGALAPNVRDL